MLVLSKDKMFYFIFGSNIEMLFYPLSKFDVCTAQILITMEIKVW